MIDNDGQVVHIWESEYSAMGPVYLRPNGNLMRGGREPVLHGISEGGQGGNLQEFSWDGDLLWNYVINSADRLLHHDFEILPNGNVLVIVWEHKTAAEARRVGRRPDRIPESGLWPDAILELEPMPPTDARIVWEWHAWDHLIQDFDPALEPYGVLSEHPGRIDINGDLDPLTSEESALLRSRGFVNPDAEPASDVDLMHVNSIDYNAHLDQIVISAHDYHEVWIIDHSTTTEEAAGATGGRYGRGGEILYRWGNPRVYGRGVTAARAFGGQHDARWIPDAYPGAGNLLVFNNLEPGPDRPFSSIVELELPLDSDGSYQLAAGQPFGPSGREWTYASSGFFAPFISGAHRLPNGHTFVTSGPRGRLFEVNPQDDVVWEYWSPYSGDVILPDGSRPQPVAFNVYAVFRATRILPDDPALQGRRLEPLSPQPPIIPPVFPGE
jgi:hypothetical protein